MVYRLENFTLSERERVEVKLSLADIKKSKWACERSQVGRIHGGNRVNFTWLKQIMSKLWSAEGELKMVELKNKMHKFFFSNKEERNRFWKNTPKPSVISCL